MADDSDYKTYDFTLPNRTRLRVLIVLGRLMILGGFVWVVLALMKELTSQDNPFTSTANCNRGYGFPYSYVQKACEPESWFTWQWYYGAALLVIGGIVTSICQHMLEEFFCVVRQGKVVARDTGGGGLSTLVWMVKIKGYTYANEPGEWWHKVNAGHWHDLKIGDMIDFEEG